MYHSTLGLRVIKKKKKMWQDGPAAGVGSVEVEQIEAASLQAPKTHFHLKSFTPSKFAHPHSHILPTPLQASQTHFHLHTRKLSNRASPHSQTLPTPFAVPASVSRLPRVRVRMGAGEPSLAKSVAAKRERVAMLPTSSSYLLLSSLELSDTTIYEPSIRALLPTSTHGAR